jgi:hypothetical protein
MSRKSHRAAKRAVPAGRNPAEGSRENAERTAAGRESCEEKIDEAVEMTFPASDPIAPGHATGTEPAVRPADRRAPVVSKEDVERAATRRDGSARPRNAGR